MRRILAAILIAGGLVAVPSMVAAKPFGYMGPGRDVRSNLDHAVRKGRGEATFKKTLVNPASAGKTRNPSTTAKARGPSSPTRPASTVGFSVAP